MSRPETAVLNRRSRQAAGLLGWWTFLDEDACHDYSGQGHHGQYGVGHTFTESAERGGDGMGHCILFPQTYESRITFSGYPFALSDKITVAVWCRPDLSVLTGLQRLRICSRQEDNVAQKRSWVFDFGRASIPTVTIKPRLLIQDASMPATVWHMTSSDVTALDDTWIHLVITWASTWSQAHFCVNGVIEVPDIDVNTPPVGTEIGTLDQAFGIGEGPVSAGTAYPFKGEMADLRVYGRTMTDEQMQHLYAEETRWELYQATEFNQPGCALGLGR
jgi:hypothetical protein